MLLKNNTHKELKTPVKRKRHYDVKIIFTLLFIYLMMTVNIILPIRTSVTTNVDKNKFHTELNHYHQLRHDAIYPAPSALAHPNATIYVQPIFGQHRPNKDAIFAFAEQYPVETYVQFLSFLTETGYKGDVVFSTSKIEKMKPNVKTYLRRQASSEQILKSGIAVIVYALDWTCFKKDGTPINNVNSGFSDCKTNLYGVESSDGSIEPINDPRVARPVATARYELYWIWSIHYKPESRILLVDVRDTYFQLNPFHNVPKLSPSNVKKGNLYLFGENHNATSISRSNYNRRWITQAYGLEKMKKIADKMVICSGATMGDANAIESYLRVMVKQFDDTKCKATGCDQGFHNYIFYYDLLKDANGIKDVIVFEQGKGIVNNLAAMRTKPLREWGVLDNETNHVLNWDKTISPVVHQFDRDDELKKIMKFKVSKLMEDIKMW